MASVSNVSLLITNGSTANMNNVTVSENGDQVLNRAFPT
jgi:hypothetical protein